MWIRTQSCDSRCRIQSLASLISWDSFRDTTAAILASSATKWTHTCSCWHSEGLCGRSVFKRQGTLNTRWFLWLANSPTALNVHWGKHGLMVSRLDSLRRGRCGDKASSGRVHPTSQCWKDIAQVTYSKNTTYWILLSNLYDLLMVWNSFKHNIKTKFTFSMIAPCLIVHFIISAHQSIFFYFFYWDFISKSFFFCCWSHQGHVGGAKI